VSSEGAAEVDCCWDGKAGMAEGLLNSPPPDISALDSLLVVTSVDQLKVHSSLPCESC
jgi:hypothetical protein